MDLTFYKTPRETWAALLADCQRARRSIEMEQYIVKDDETGNAFLDLFLKKQREGVQIRLLLDRIGSRSVYNGDAIEKLKEAGAQIRFYNPPKLFDVFRPSRWFPRNHVKTTLIDSEIAYIGGVCLENDMADWRDTQIRIVGSLVTQIEQYFSKERIGWRSRAHAFARSDVDARLPFEYMMHRPHLGPNPIYKRLVREINGAKTSVQLVTPYFLPPFGLRRAIRKALRRGVTVTIMLGGSTDSPIADYVSQSYFPWMVRKGIHILRYKNFMLHAKYAIVDDAWATIGSTNLDYLSLKHNREANIMIRDPEVIATLKQHFADDIRDCYEVGRNDWKKLPFYIKFLGYAGRSIRKIL